MLLHLHPQSGLDLNQKFDVNVTLNASSVQLYRESICKVYTTGMSERSGKAYTVGMSERTLHGKRIQRGRLNIQGKHIQWERLNIQGKHIQWGRLNGHYMESIYSGDV